MNINAFVSDLALFKRSFVIESCSTSLPGGDQVDGSPPAAILRNPAIRKRFHESS